MSYPTDIDDLQHALKQWTEKQFPTRNTGSIMAHLKSEADEVEENATDVFEYADCMMLILDAASYNNIHASDILRACEEKLEINKNRTWGEPNSDGFCEHKK